MKYKDYYETLGVPRGATQDDIKQAYRKLARKYHPDVSKMADAEARFKEINEANEVLKDPEKRAAYDQMGSNWKAGQDFQPPPNWDAGFEFRGGQGGGRSAPAARSAAARASTPSDFFESLFGRRGARRPAGRAGARSVQGEDHHAKVLIDLEDSYRGAERSISLRAPVETPDGRVAMQERTLDVHIPKGIRPGPAPAPGRPGRARRGRRRRPATSTSRSSSSRIRVFRVEGADVYVDLPLAPWEAALGATVDVPTPEGTVQLTVPKGSQAGRKLRLKGRGLPGKNPGDLYAVLAIVAPKADTEAARAAYETLAKAFPDFKPRAHLQG